MKKLLLSLTIGIMLIAGLLVVHSEARARNCEEEAAACMKYLNDRDSCNILARYCETHNF